MRWFVWVGLVVLLSTGAAYADIYQQIDAGAATVNDEVIAWRRDLHQHPELSNREVRTAALVADALRTLNIEVTTGIARTGVVGVLRGGQAGGVVALRADMDALPVVETTGLAFASTVRSQYDGESVGVMHACGHDNHVAILLGVATVLAGIREQLPGTVKFIFQPAEEGAPAGEEGGADVMVAEGVLENPHVDAIFGLHVMQLDEVGQVSVRARGLMASSQRFEIDITGRQSHGAMPWAGVDPIVIGAQIVTALQTIVARSVDITSAPAVVTVGTFHSGVRYNIIPGTATLKGTIRTFDPTDAEVLPRRVRDIAVAIAGAMGGSASMTLGDANPVTFNDPTLTQRMRPSLVRVYGDANVLEKPPQTTAEDFSFYQQHVPGMFFFVGVRPAGVPASQAIPNHSPQFDADEGALENAVRAMATLAVDYLEG